MNPTRLQSQWTPGNSRDEEDGQVTGGRYNTAMSKLTFPGRQHGRIFLIVIVMVLAAAAGLIVAQQMMQRTAEWRAAQLFPTPRPLADFELFTAEGERFSKADLEGQWNLLFFGFTNCPDVCPDTLAMLAQSMNQLALMRQDVKPQVVFVSVDPERDRGELLGDYVRWFSPDFVGVSGDDRQLQALSRQIGIVYYLEEPDEATGFYNVDHSASVLIVDPQGRLFGRFAHPLDPELVTADLFQLGQL
jgi:protein SCO1